MPQQRHRRHPSCHDIPLPPTPESPAEPHAIEQGTAQQPQDELAPAKDEASDRRTSEKSQTPSMPQHGRA